MRATFVVLVSLSVLRVLPLLSYLRRHLMAETVDINVHVTTISRASVHWCRVEMEYAFRDLRLNLECRRRSDDRMVGWSDGQRFRPPEDRRNSHLRFKFINIMMLTTGTVLGKKGSIQDSFSSDPFPSSLSAWSIMSNFSSDTPERSSQGTNCQR